MPLVGALGLSAWALATPAGAAPAGAALTSSAAPASSTDSATSDTAGEEALRSRVASLATEGGHPAVLASVTDAGGWSTNVAIGEGDTATGEAPPVDGEVRIGSNTKTFVAVVVLQLIEEGRVSLDEPVETYLPGLLRGEGIDASAITVRQLLQHTSGLPEYTTEEMVAAMDADPQAYRSPYALLDTALASPAQFAPGAEFRYTNTNYLVAGMLVEAVTQRTVGEQIEDRIIEPLGLERTYLPHPGERLIRGTHPHGYLQEADGGLRDVTELDPSWAWAAGGMVSTPSELNEFMQAIVDGTLLRPESLEQMQTTVSAGQRLGERASYGLGLVRTELSCGEVAWGHGGGIPGYLTFNAVDSEGTAATIALTSLSLTGEELVPNPDEVLDTVLCEN